MVELTRSDYRIALSEMPEYMVWAAMKQRCYNKKCAAYKHYGRRGISVCKRWRNSFENFLKDMGRVPSLKHSIGRVNNDSDYKPSNCKWATDKEQANNRRSNVRVKFKSKTQTISQWAEELGINANTLYRRYKTNGTQDFDKPVSISVKYRGKIKTISEWAIILGIDRGTLWYRYNKIEIKHFGKNVDLRLYNKKQIPIL